MSRRLALPIPHLVYEDWEPYMESIFDTEDDKVKAMVLSQRKHVTERRIRKVNELYDAMKEIWPDGNSLLFYIALEKGKYVDEQIVEELRNQDFVREIEKEGQERGLYPCSEIEEAQPVRPVVGDNFESSDSSSDDDDDDIDVSDHRRKSVKRWTDPERTQLKEIITNAASLGITTWKEIAKHFPGRTVEQCQNLYHRMRGSKELNVEFRQRKSSKKLGRPPKYLREERDRARAFQKQVKHILGITFTYKNKTAFVGPESDKMRTIANSNPFANYIDPLMKSKIRHPAISPDGILLDYRTWEHCLATTAINPYTQVKVTKRQLTFVTWDNIDELLPKIRNWRDCKPENDEDDLLKPYLENIFKNGSGQDHDSETS